MHRICVIFNPTSGRRRAGRRLEAFQRRWQGRVDFWPTETAGHAVSLAGRAVDEGFQTIAAAGGDGTVHEVANGLLRSDAREVTFAVVPIGSANDYAYSIEQQFGVTQLDDETAAPVDAGILRTPDGRDQFFVECVGIGLTADITVASRQIAHRQGLCLYGTAAYQVLRQGRPALPLSLTQDDASPIEARTRLLSVLLGQREGKVPMAKHALLDDGQFDVVHCGEVGHWEALGLLPQFLLGGPPENHPRIAKTRCRRLRVTSGESLAVHTDGEVFATNDDKLHDVDIQVLPRRLRVKVCRP